ncbi:MAG: hypothetical protein SFV32_08840 [Opitutaceae bacterium]|nr:hypothetical protein [Opitutaceae bacterium]
MFGVLPLNKHFADLYVFPSALHELQKGGDPYLSNPTDPWGRPYNYPSTWLTFMRFPARSIPVLGIALGLSWLAGLLATWGRLSLAQGLIGGAMICSPPVVLALERANTDLVIGILLMASLALLKRQMTVSTWLVVAAAFVLKLYPGAAFSAFLRMGWKRGVPYIAAAAILVSSVVAWRLQELRMIAQNTPSGMVMSFGSTTWIKATQRLQRNRDILRDAEMPSRLLALALALGTAAAGFYWRKAHVGDQEGLDGFRISASIFLLTFILGGSYLYRLIFLLFSLPWLWQPAARPESTFPIIRRVALGALFGLAWLNPFWWFPIIFARELCAWTLLLALSWLLGATLPRLRPLPPLSSVTATGSNQSAAP